MDETARHRAARHAAAHTAARIAAARERRSGRDADRRNAAAALQRSLDRRDNGGATGH